MCELCVAKESQKSYGKTHAAENQDARNYQKIQFHDPARTLSFPESNGKNPFVFAVVEVQQSSQSHP